jgi:hypothetical protein
VPVAAGREHRLGAGCGVHLGHDEEVLEILVGGTDQNRDVPGVVRTAG